MSDTPSVGEFEAAARRFLDAHLPPRRASTELRWGMGSDDVSLFKRWRSAAEELDDLERCTAWRRTKFDNGFGWIDGPEELGGAGLSREHAHAWTRLEREYAAPSEESLAIGLGMVAPTILAHGTDAVRRRYVAAMYRGDVVGCQLFSEPGAGSDIAGLATRAVRDGDTWVVNGQKVWTSGAHFSHIGLLLCRTDADLPKHRGLSAFVVDMRAEGVDVRPLRQMTGTTNFNEVFFTDVRIAGDHLLGEVNGGWSVALTTLMNERSSIGGSGSSGTISRLRGLVAHLELECDAVVRDRFARLYISHRIAELTHQRARATAAAGRPPGPIMSIGKLTRTQNMQAVADFVSGALGARLQADTGEWGTYAWADFLLGVPGYRVGGGTDEIMRNILGEQVLGLPKEPR